MLVFNPFLSGIYIYIHLSLFIDYFNIVGYVIRFYITVFLLRFCVFTFFVMASTSGDADNAAMFVGLFDVEDSNNVDSCQQEIVTLEPLASTSHQQEDAFQCVNIRIHEHDSCG